ncbi:MAG TPA: carbohydrate kinase family protein [Planctomycetaceae bacterium]|nr:carbohydrate kinase family protein [Planctomycetaceae bacterium]
MSDAARPHDCLCAGIIVADQVCEPIAAFPPPGGLALSPRLTFTIGGCAANAAVDLAKLGLSVGLHGCLGGDLFGQALAEMMSTAGVDCRGLVTVADRPTSGTFVINVQGEDRRFIHCIGANAAFDGTQVTDADLRSTSVLAVGGYCLLEALTPERVIALFQRARQAGVMTLLDVVLGDRTDYWNWIAPVMPWTDAFLPNDHEARRITGLDRPRDQARRLREAGCRNVVITCGGEGVLLDGDDGVWRADVYPVPIVDATGTGDAFLAGYVYGLKQGADVPMRLKYGAALGASCVRAIGATTGVFNAAELEDYVHREPLKIERLA